MVVTNNPEPSSKPVGTPVRAVFSVAIYMTLA
jgi:hypothetical protein